MSEDVKIFESNNSEYDLFDLTGESSELELGLTYLADVQGLVNSNTPWMLEPTPDNLRTMGLALCAEVVEFLNETGWKPWRKPVVVDKAKAAGEFADILAFVGMLVSYASQLGIPPGELAAAYAAKSRINFNRLAGRVEGFGAEDPKWPKNSSS